jgi:hypothetical protein
MKTIIKILIEKMKATLSLRHRSTQQEYARLIEKFDVVKRIPVSVINNGPRLTDGGPGL